MSDVPLPPVPTWAVSGAPVYAADDEQAAATPWSMDCVKGGAVVSTTSLHGQSRYLLGRADGLVDVLLEHPSVSRVHAALQHSKEGKLFLIDNGSAHGS